MSSIISKKKKKLALPKMCCILINQTSFESLKDQKKNFKRNSGAASKIRRIIKYILWRSITVFESTSISNELVASIRTKHVLKNRNIIFELRLTLIYCTYHELMKLTEELLKLAKSFWDTQYTFDLYFF